MNAGFCMYRGAHEMPFSFSAFPQEIVVGLRVAISPSLINEEKHATCKVIVVGTNQATFTGGYVLSLLQAETADGAHCADQPFGVPRHKRLCTILNDRYVMALSKS